MTWLLFGPLLASSFTGSYDKASSSNGDEEGSEMAACSAAASSSSCSCSNIIEIASEPLFHGETQSDVGEAPRLRCAVARFAAARSRAARTDRSFDAERAARRIAHRLHGGRAQLADREFTASGAPVMPPLASRVLLLQHRFQHVPGFAPAAKADADLRPGGDVFRCRPCRFGVPARRARSRTLRAPAAH